MTLQETIVQILISKKLIAPDFAVSKSLRKAVLRLSDSFTRDRSDLPANYFDEEIYRMAYLASFMLTNAAKVVACLRQLLDLLPANRPLSIIDIGTGPGTAVFAASSLFFDRAISFTALEKTSAILSEATRLKVVIPSNHSVKWIAGDIKKIPDKQFDLAVAANVFNELKNGERLKVCKELLSRSKYLVIVDPALKQTTRSLMKLRDELLGGSLANVVAPCTHQNTCPMLTTNQRDWCHFYIEWNRPRLIEAVDLATGLDHRYLKTGYMILKSSNSEISAPAHWRVVSSPLKSKGKLELVVCGNGQLKKLRRLDKNISETNSQFGRAMRGDVVMFSEKERPGEIRAQDSFDIVFPFIQPSNP